MLARSTRRFRIVPDVPSVPLAGHLAQAGEPPAVANPICGAPSMRKASEKPSAAARYISRWPTASSRERNSTVVKSSTAL